MSIRTLMSFGLPPLILVMGLLMAIAAELSVGGELRRGVSETGITAARATAEFVSSRLDEGRPYEEPLRRLLGFGQILEVRVLPRPGQSPVMLAGPEGATDLLRSPLPPAAMAALARGDAWVGSLEATDVAPVVRAVAPMRDGGSVATVASVASLVAHAEGLRRGFIAVTLLFTAVAAIMALLSSRWLIAGIGALEVQAGGLITGASPRVKPREGIRELSDLSLTFATMRSILEDSVSRGRRALLARPIPSALRTAVFHDRAVAEVDTVVAGHRVTARVVGPAAPGFLSGAAEGGGEGRAFVGLTSGSDAADRALEAAAAGAFLQARLAGHGDPLEAVRDAERLFRFSSLRWATWTAQDRGSRRIHTLPDGADRALDALEALFDSPDQAATGAAMAGALPDLGPGVLMLIRPVDATPAATEGT